jgi:hypothetical protein
LIQVALAIRLDEKKVKTKYKVKGMAMPMDMFTCGQCPKLGYPTNACIVFLFENFVKDLA